MQKSYVIFLSYLLRLWCQYQMDETRPRPQRSKDSVSIKIIRDEINLCSPILTVKILQRAYLSLGVNKIFSFLVFLFSNKPIMMVLHKSWCQISQGKFFMSKQQCKLEHLSTL